MTTPFFIEGCSISEYLLENERVAWAVHYTLGMLLIGFNQLCNEYKAFRF